MSNYAILRTQKLKTIQDVAGSGSHVFRLRDTPNADPARTSENKVLVGGESNLLHQVVNSRIENGLNEKAKVRKDSVRAIEFMLTASPDWFEKATKKQFEQWQEANVDWLKSKYGEANLVSAVLHVDEQTPHIHAHIVPITADGRLSAKDLIGGTRHRLKELQTDYAEAMKPFGLERGSEKSIAKHQDIKTYYKVIDDAKNEKVKIPKIEDPPIFFGKEEYVKKLKKNYVRISKKAKYWRHESMRLKNNSNSKAVEEAEKKRKEAEEQQKKLSEMCNKLLDQKSKIDAEYNRYKKMAEQELSAKNEANQRLIEKNKRLREKLEKKNVKNFSM